MSERSLLSVGVPAYNQGEFLAETLESLLNQTECPLEIVVSDNWSTDNTPDVLEDFVDRVRVVRPPKHLPMVAHCNFLARQLRGEWLSLLSSDDVAMPNYVATLCNGTQRVPDAVLVRSGVVRIDGEGKTVSSQYLLSVKRITRAPRTMREQLVGSKVSFAAFALKRSAFKQVGGFPDCNIFFDWGMWLKLAPLGAFVYEHDLISKYRSDYRPNLQRRRLLAELEDFVTVYTDLIPSLASTMPGIKETELIRASRARLLRTLSHITQTTQPSDGDRKEAIRIVSPWADHVGCKSELDELSAGRVIRWRRPAEPLRRAIRGLYGQVRRFV